MHRKTKKILENKQCKPRKKLKIKRKIRDKLMYF